jgi:uncharacterized protein (TIGR02466 family)
MTTFQSFFATRLLRAELPSRVATSLNSELVAAIDAIRDADIAGREWSHAHGYPGYTSYASLDDLPSRDPSFGALAERLEGFAKAFAEDQAWALGRAKLRLDAMWINVLPPGGFHSGHIHPGSVISGTYYVAVPAGAPALRIEDPRLGLMMGAPPRAISSDPALNAFQLVTPEPGTVLMWESWLRHEVPLNQSRKERISISFNYSWE